MPVTTNDEVFAGIGSSDAYTREMGIRLPSNMYAYEAMGMRIVSAKYYIYNDFQSSDYNYIFRIYGQGANNQPGELQHDDHSLHHALHIPA